MKKYDELRWRTVGRERLLHTPVFDVDKQKEVTDSGLTGEYVGIQAPDWVVIVAVHGDNFILVRQWRHGEENLTLEFPGGVVDPNEDPKTTACRELEEETGYRAGKMTLLGRVSSNPALFKNHFSVFLAEDLVQTGKQHLDKDELLKYEEMPIKDVIRSYGDHEFTHAFMGTALAFYFRYLGEKGSR